MSTVRIASRILVHSLRAMGEMGVSFLKLKTGDWGVRGLGVAPRTGETISVQKKDGTRSSVVIAKIVWQDSKAWIAEIKAKGGGSSGREPTFERPGPGGTYVCDECGDFVRPGTRCWETGMRH